MSAGDREMDSGGGGTTDSTDSTTSTDSTSRSISFEAIAPAWLADNLQALRVFLSNPLGYIAGAGLAFGLAGLESITEAVLAAVFSVFDAVTFVLTLNGGAVLDLGGDLSSIVLNGIVSANDVLLGAAQATGPFAPIVGTAILVVEAILALWLLEQAVRVIIDIVPGLGGLI